MAKLDDLITLTLMSFKREEARLQNHHTKYEYSKR